jgi:hypothetical protein
LEELHVIACPVIGFPHWSVTVAVAEVLVPAAIEPDPSVTTTV